MAQEKIIISFKAVGAPQLERAIRNLTKAQKDLENGVVRTTKTNKKHGDGLVDTTHKTRNLNNAFSTMRSKLLLVNFAMGLGVAQLIKFAEAAAKVESMGRAFDTLSGGSENASIAIEKLKSATNDTMSEMDLFQQANNAMILGVSKNSDEMAEMFDIAQRLGRALGRDTRSSVESLITGIGRQSRLMLDNIGIIVKADEAYEMYASTLGKTSDSLTDAEKKQAFLSATMESAREKVATLGKEVMGTQDSFDMLKTSVGDTSVALGGFISRILELPKSAQTMADILKIAESLLEANLSMKDAERLSNIATREMESFLGMLVKVGSLGLANLEFVKEGIDNISESIEDAVYWSSELGESLETDLTPSLSFIDELYKQTNESQLALVETRMALLESFIEINGATQEEIAVLALLLEQKEKLLGSDKLKVEQDKKIQDALKKQIQLAENMADAIGRSVLNANSFANAIGRIGDAIIAEAARLIANQAARWFLKSALGMIGGPFAGIAAGMSLIFHQGGLVPEKKPVQRFATGGTVQGGDNVPILAQGGEFVMSRSAVESIGIENLNRMNQGGGGAINVSIQGNLLTEEYVETELAEKISTAVRRGVDFGIS